MSSWTPGPWECNRDGLILDKRGRVIAQVSRVSGDADENVSNGFVIAAAPEMAEGLVPLANLYRSPRMDQMPDDYPVYQTAGIDGEGTITVGDLRRARALLAKINGGRDGE